MRAFGRLALLALLTALATSRVTLAYHELLGHGGGAVLAGGRVDEVQLYLFAGGYVRYTLPEPASFAAQVATALGGIVLELVVGALALVLARRLPAGSRWRFPLIGSAAIVIIHGLYYLAAGVHHGYGDGWWLARRLGDARWMVTLPAAVLALLACGPLATLLARTCAAWCPGATNRRRVLALAGAALFAGGAHLALAVLEVRLFPLATYRETMKPQVEREVDAALARMLEEARRQGVAEPGPDVLARERARVRTTEHRFPLDRALAGALAVIATLGLVRGLGGAPRAAAARGVPTGVLAAAGLACGSAIGLIAVLRLAL